MRKVTCKSHVEAARGPVKAGCVIRKSEIDAQDRRRVAAARRHHSFPPFVALIRRETSRQFFIGIRADGSQKMIFTSEALRLHPGAMDFPEGQRIELKQRKAR